MIDEDFDYGIEYICQNNKQSEKYVVVSVCRGKYDFEGLFSYNIKNFEQSNLTKTR